MILFTILLITLIVLLAVSVVAIGAGGAAMIVVFGDVIVCMGFIIGIMRWLIRKKKR